MIPVVFLHGIGGGARWFAPQIASFAAAGYQPVALDLLGYGTREPVEAMSFEALAEDVEFAIGESGLERPVLVGHSMGGMVVQTMLRRRPQRLCAPPCSPAPRRRSAIRPAISRRSSWPIASRRSMPARPWRTSRPAPPTTSWGRTPIRPGARCSSSNMRRVPEATYRAAVKCLVTFDERANLPNIKVPVLCLAAEHDRNAPPPVLEKMAAKIPGALLLLPVRPRPHAEPGSAGGFRRARSSTSSIMRSARSPDTLRA